MREGAQPSSRNTFDSRAGPQVGAGRAVLSRLWCCCRCENAESSGLGAGRRRSEPTWLSIPGGRRPSLT